jgi:tetratricopeptide (TPR) repeat protein
VPHVTLSAPHFASAGIRAQAAQIAYPGIANRYQVTAIAIGIVLATIFLFSRSIETPFFNYDDPIYVQQNSHVSQGLCGAGLKWALVSGIKSYPPYDCGNWHPLTWLSLQADASLWGKDDFRGFHLTSIVLHAVNSALVFLFLNAATRRLLPSLLLTLFWAWHPLRVESVTWVSERKDVLSAFFFLLALLSYLWYSRSPQWSRYFLVVLLFVAGLMAKPMVVTLPVLLLLIDYWPLRRISAVEPALSGAALFLEKVPLLMLSCASSVITVLAQRADGAMKAMEYFTFLSRLLNAGLAYIEYLWTMIWPLSLAPLYPLRRISVLVGLLAWLTIIVATVAAIRLRKRHPSIPMGWLWYLIMLVPVLGLVQVGYQCRADRYTYLPMIGVLMAIGFGAGRQGSGLAASSARLERKSAWPRATAPVVCVALLLLAGATWREQGYWDNPLRIWEHNLEIVGPDALIEYQAGEASQRQSNLANAESHYRQAIKLVPTYTDAYVNLGSVLLSQERPADALPYLEEAVRLKRDQIGSHRNLGLALLRLKRFEEAAAQYREEVRLDPTDPEMWEWLGFVELQADQFDAAFESFAKAASLRPQHGLYFAECAHARRSSHEDEARQIYKHSFRVDPEWARHAATEVDFFLKAADPTQRDPALALFLAETVCEATARGDAGYLELLSRAQAANGDYAKAAATMQEAIDRKPRISTQVMSQWSEQLRHFKAMQARPTSQTNPGKTAANR